MPTSHEKLSRAYMVVYMATTPKRQALLDSWIETFGGADEFFDFFTAFIEPKIWNHYKEVFTDPSIERYTSREFASIFSSFLSVGQMQTHRVIQRKAPDPDGIKPILILFSIAVFYSTKELSKWIDKTYRQHFHAIAEMLLMGVEPALIPTAIKSGIDASTIFHYGANHLELGNPLLKLRIA